MDGLGDLAARLDEAAESLAELARRLPYAGPVDGDPLHADGPGRPGQIGRALREEWVAALDNRARELTGAAERLTDTSAVLRTAARGYADGDEAARRRLTGGS